MKYKYLDHTSEAKFQAFGKTMEEAFANAGLAMSNLMVDIEEVKPEKKVEIMIESDKLESLLYDFLDEIIFIRDTQLIFLSKFEDLKIEQGEKCVLTTIAYGDEIKKYDTGGDVKAPTYDDMKIEEKDEWMIQVVVDV